MLSNKLLCLPALFRGRAWAIYDSLGEESTNTYAYLKSALLHCLCPNTKEDCVEACEQLSKRKLQEGKESIDEVACDLDKLLNKASPGLPILDYPWQQDHFMQYL